MKRLNIAKKLFPINPPRVRSIKIEQFEAALKVYPVKIRVLCPPNICVEPLISWGRRRIREDIHVLQPAKLSEFVNFLKGPDTIQTMLLRKPPKVGLPITLAFQIGLYGVVFKEPDGLPERPRQQRLFEERERREPKYRPPRRAQERKGIITPQDDIPLEKKLYYILMPPLEDFIHDSQLLWPGEPYPFQWEGISWLYPQNHALLADEMGLGKTIQALVAFRFLVRAGVLNDALIICPASLRPNWEREANKWAPELVTSVIEGSPAERRWLWESRAHLKIASYETVRNDLEAIKEEAGAFDLVIIDEGQRIKNPEAQVSRAVKELKRQRSWCLTGTPLENKPEDLCSIFDFVKPGLVDWRQTQVQGYHDIPKKIQPHFLRRKKKDVLPQLPPKEYMDVWLKLTDEQQEAYERAESEGKVYLRQLGQEVTVAHIWSLITRLKQICNFEPRSESSCKLEFLMELLEEIAESGKKALIFSQFKETAVAYLSPKLHRYNPLVYHGGMSHLLKHEDSRNPVYYFKTSGDHPILLLTLKAGGLGLNLEVADYVFHYDRWWNPAVEQQAEDRAHRIGQKNKLMIYRFAVKDTIEERILAVIKEKQILFEELVEGVPSPEKIFTKEELMRIVGLEPAERQPPLEEDLGSLSPADFERTVARYFEDLGFIVKQTQHSKDGGIDAILLATGQRVVVQCKRYKDSVGVDKVRELWGVITHDPSITRGILVATSDFSREAYEFAQDKKPRLDLITGEEFRNQLQGLRRP